MSCVLATQRSIGCGRGPRCNKAPTLQHDRVASAILMSQKRNESNLHAGLQRLKAHGVAKPESLSPCCARPQVTVYHLAVMMQSSYLAVY